MSSTWWSGTSRPRLAIFHSGESRSSPDQRQAPHTPCASIAIAITSMTAAATRMGPDSLISKAVDPSAVTKPSRRTSQNSFELISVQAVHPEDLQFGYRA